MTNITIRPYLLSNMTNMQFEQTMLVLEDIKALDSTCNIEVCASSVFDDDICIWSNVLSLAIEPSGIIYGKQLGE